MLQNEILSEEKLTSLYRPEIGMSVHNPIQKIGELLPLPSLCIAPPRSFYFEKFMLIQVLGKAHTYCKETS